MDGSILHIMPGVGAGERETAADRLRRLKLEMKAAALDEVRDLEAAMDHLIEIAGDISSAGDVFPCGVLERCRGLVEEVTASREAIRLLMLRAG